MGCEGGLICGSHSRDCFRCWWEIWCGQGCWEVVGKVHVGEDTVVVGQVAWEGIGEVHVEEVVGPVVGEFDGTVHVEKYETGRLLLVRLLARLL